MTISGYTCVRHAIELDYPVHLTIESLLAGCDEVVVGCASGNDETLLRLCQWKGREPKLKVIPQLWKDPNGDVRWWTKWVNETREHLTGDMQLMLDADEVFDPAGYAELRRAPLDACYTMHRLNFWRDARSLIPHDHCCSHKVVRFAPRDLWMTSDEIYKSEHFPEDEPEIRKRAVDRMDLQIFHLGFLRKPEALFKKVEVNLRAFFGSSQDPRLIEAMKHPEKHWTDFCQFRKPLIPFTGKHPDFCEMWLKERGAL